MQDTYEVKRMLSGFRSNSAVPIFYAHYPILSVYVSPGQTLSPLVLEKVSVKMGHISSKGEDYVYDTFFLISECENKACLVCGCDFYPEAKGNMFKTSAEQVGLKEGIFTIGAVLTLKENCGAGLHIPSDATEEVLSLALPFGKVTNILMLKGKRQRAEAMFHPVDTTLFESQPVASASEARDDPFPDVRCVLRIIVDNVSHHISLEMLHEILSPFGPVLRIIIFTKYGKFQALAEYDNPRSAYCAKKTLNGQGIFTSDCFIRVDYSKFTSLAIKYNNEKSRDFTRLDLPSGDGQIYMDQPIAAAYGIQNNIVPSYTGAAGFTPNMSFSQGAGIYGNVHRVKIMFRTKEKALVQMADANQARLAISYLNGQKLYGRVLHATFSKHHTVQLLRGGRDDQGLTKDYSNSPLHRFKIPGSKNFQNIFPPSATLHLSNIPSCVTVDDMKNLFASTGCTVKACRFFRNNCRTALIQLGSVEEAVHALIELHNHDLGQNRTLRVSFAKHTI
ncbi:Ptbp3 [Columba livia]|nr:Ptbp3 [Columba livia]